MALLASWIAVRNRSSITTDDWVSDSFRVLFSSAPTHSLPHPWKVVWEPNALSSGSSLFCNASAPPSLKVVWEPDALSPVRFGCMGTEQFGVRLSGAVAA